MAAAASAATGVPKYYVLFIETYSSEFRRWSSEAYIIPQGENLPERLAKGYKMIEPEFIKYARMTLPEFLAEDLLWNGVEWTLNIDLVTYDRMIYIVNNGIDIPVESNRLDEFYQALKIPLYLLPQPANTDTNNPDRTHKAHCHF